MLFSTDSVELDLAELFTGSVDQFVIHPREVIREALRRNAEAVVWQPAS